MSSFNSYSEIPYFFIISFNLTNFVPRGFRTRKLKIREKFIAKPSLNLIGFGAVKDRSIVDLLFAARLQSFVRSSQKDIRLSSAALGRLNIYLAFIDGEILGEVCHSSSR